jgi:hypothetical protein
LRNPRAPDIGQIRKDIKAASAGMMSGGLQDQVNALLGDANARRELDAALAAIYEPQPKMLPAHAA